MSDLAHLPAALNMKGRAAIIVGGGSAAADKAAYLADFGVRTSVLVEPNEDVADSLLELARAQQIVILRQPYAASILAGYSLVVAATRVPDRDRAIATDARAGGAIVNMVDDPDACDVFAVGYVRRGPVSVAVSTGGRSPALAAALREHLEDLLDPEIEAHLEQYSAWRERIRAAVTTPQAREQLWRELRAAGLYGVLRAEGPEVAGLLVDEGITRYADGSLTVEDSAP